MMLNESLLLNRSSSTFTYLLQSTTKICSFSVSFEYQSKNKKWVLALVMVMLVFIKNTQPCLNMKRILSGVQLIGSVHLGNYLGATENWITLQDTNETLFFIVDLHGADIQNMKDVVSSAVGVGASFVENVHHTHLSEFF